MPSKNKDHKREIGIKMRTEGMKWVRTTGIRSKEWIKRDKVNWMAPGSRSKTYDNIGGAGLW